VEVVVGLMGFYDVLSAFCVLIFDRIDEGIATVSVIDVGGVRVAFYLFVIERQQFLPKMFAPSRPALGCPEVGD